MQNIFAICSLNLPVSFFVCSIKQRKKKGKNLWWNIFAWLRMGTLRSAKVASVCISAWQIQAGGVDDLLPQVLQPFHGWPGLARVWATARWCKNMTSVYLKKEKKKASDEALRVLKKKSMPALVGLQKKVTHEHTRAHTLSHKVDSCESLVHRDESIKTFLSTLRE